LSCLRSVSISEAVDRLATRTKLFVEAAALRCRLVLEPKLELLELWQTQEMDVGIQDGFLDRYSNDI
jgi:hypothetical protein